MSSIAPKRPVATPVARAVKISLQCSEGSFPLSLDLSTNLRDTKRALKQAHEPLSEVNMNLFVISFNGQFFADDSVTLRAIGVEDNAVLFLVKHKTIPSLNAEEKE